MSEAANLIGPTDISLAFAKLIFGVYWGVILGLNFYSPTVAGFCLYLGQAQARLSCSGFVEIEALKDAK